MKKILVVDDNSFNITIIVKGLGLGYDTRAALSAAEAFEAMEEELPDLILLDVVMDEMDGIEMCKKIKKNLKTAHIPVIFLTASYDDGCRTEAYLAGADDFLVKPYDKVLLNEKIKMLLED